MQTSFKSTDMTRSGTGIREGKVSSHTETEN